jgi:hypothetical protein
MLSISSSSDPLNFAAHDIAVLTRDGSLVLASRSKQGAVTYMTACLCEN